MVPGIMMIGAIGRVADVDGDTRIEVADLHDGRAMRAVEDWLAARTDATPFHRPAWVAATTASTGNEGFFLIARDERDGIVGILPLAIVHSAVFGRALVSSPFAVAGGILADCAAVTHRLADAAMDIAARRACTSVELRGGSVPGNGWTTRDDAYLGFARPLADDDEAELATVPRKHRAELRKALSAGLDISIGRGPEHRSAHYALYRRSVHNLGSPVFPKRLFDAVLDALPGETDIMVVSANGVALSAVLTLYHQGVCMPYWQGGLPAARDVRANELLYFRLMGHARRRGCRRFDFGRSKVGTGPAAYKRNWGFEGQPLSYHVRATAREAIRDVNPLSPRYARKIELWRRLPAALVDRVGPWVARGLG